MTQTTNELPVMECPSCEDGTLYAPSSTPNDPSEYDDCPKCDGTCEVLDIDKIKDDLAGAEKDCPCTQNARDAFVNSCKRCHQLGAHFECTQCIDGKVSLLLGLRKVCPGINIKREGWGGAPNTCVVRFGNWADGQPVEQECICQGRTWIADVTMPKLMVALTMQEIIYLLGNYNKTSINGGMHKAEVWFNNKESVEYIHANPEVALLGAAWSALQTIEVKP